MPKTEATAVKVEKNGGGGGEVGEGKGGGGGGGSCGGGEAGAAPSAKKSGGVDGGAGFVTYNGGVCDRYRWSQTLEVFVFLFIRLCFFWGERVISIAGPKSSRCVCSLYVFVCVEGTHTHKRV